MSCGVRHKNRLKYPPEKRNPIYREEYRAGYS
jgi:hypothetical protein